MQLFAVAVHSLVRGLQKRCPAGGRVLELYEVLLSIHITHQVWRVCRALSIRGRCLSGSWLSERYFFTWNVNISRSHSVNNCLVTQAFSLPSHDNSHSAPAMPRGLRMVSLVAESSDQCLYSHTAKGQSGLCGLVSQLCFFLPQDVGSAWHLIPEEPASSQLNT